MQSTYIIKETQNLNSEREGEGKKFTGDLVDAKRYALENQCFFGTVLKIEDQDGNLICFKKDGGRWEETNYQLR